MFRLIIILVVAFFVIRLVYRRVQQHAPKKVDPIELKACAYCGVLVRVDKMVVMNGRFFCCSDHAKRLT
ncbi:MAG: hypothetical protein KGO49_10240 [Gammaproteobacteria bacterium]|nr:hypothetical protein [Gammaproteobacteria bacterium]